MWIRVKCDDGQVCMPDRADRQVKRGEENALNEKTHEQSLLRGCN